MQKAAYILLLGGLVIGHGRASSAQGFVGSIIAGGGPVLAIQSPMRVERSVEEVTVLEPREPQREEAQISEPHDPMALRLGHGRTTRGNIAHRILHFTFDDGPRLDTTPRLLDYLDDANIRATFFLVTRGFDGHNTRDVQKAALAREIAARGHVIGAHTHEHHNLTTLSPKALRHDFDAAAATFESIFDARPALFRAPYGARNREANRAIRGAGFTHMLWNITAGDTRSQRASDIVEGFNASLDGREHHPQGPGVIVLLHDTNRRVVDAFPAMIASIHARNCLLLEAGEELWDIADTPDLFFQPRQRYETATTVVLDDEVLELRQQIVRAAAVTYCR